MTIRPLQLAAAASAVAVIIGFVVDAKVPGGLPARSDVAGYPMATGFDIRRFRNVYFFWVLVVPLLAVAIYAALCAVVRGRGQTFPVLRERAALASPVSDLGPLVASPTRRAAVVRGMAAGGIIGCEIGAMAESRLGGQGLWWTLAGASLGALVSGIAHRRSSTLHGYAIAVALTASVLGLVGLSRTTAALTPEGAVLRLHPWMPAWMGALLTLAVGTWFVLAFRRRPAIEVAHRSLVAGGGMLAHMLLRASLPASLGTPDLFHHGEQLSGSKLLLDGAWPWRDFLAIHGVTLDSLHGAVGFVVFEESYWGLTAGWLLLVDPVAAGLTYLLVARLVRYDGVLATTFNVAHLGLPIVGGIFLVNHTRAILLPLVLLALIAYLERVTWTRAALACGSMFLLVTGTPEMGYLLFGYALVLPLADWLSRPKGAASWSSFPATMRFGIFGVLYTTVFALILGLAGALDDFVFMVRTFAPDHDLTGGIPITISGFAAKVPMYGIPVATVATFFVLYRRRASLTSVDLAMLALAVFHVFYYTKFLSRADLHVLHPWGTVVALLVYLACYLLDVLLARSPTSQPAQRRMDRTFAGLGVAFALLFPVTSVAESVGRTMGNLSERLRPVITGSSVAGLGYTVADEGLIAALPDLEYLFDEAAGRPLTVFDFSNQPGLYQFLVDGRNPTRYPHVSVAIRSATQRDLIEQLEANPPDVVAYVGDGRGLFEWDGIINPVRHYDVSEWILRNYEPWLTIHGQTLLQRNGAALPAISAVAPFVTGKPSEIIDTTFAPRCEWRQLSERLPYDGATMSPPQPVEPIATMVRLTGWLVHDGVAPLEVAAVIGTEVNSIDRLRVDRPDVSALAPLEAGTMVGYDLLVPLFEGQSEDIALLALWPDGTRTIVDGVGSPSAQQTAALSMNVPIGGPGQAGNLDTQTVMTAGPSGFDLGGGSPVAVGGVRLRSPESSSWLQLRGNALQTSGGVVVTTSLGDPQRQIAAESIGGDDVITLQVGACPQWYEALDVPRWLTTGSSLEGWTVALAQASDD